MEDQTENGSRFRILTLIDEYTRECLATHAALSIRAVDVITVVEAAIERYGAPEQIRSDNELEFIAYAIKDWLSVQGVKTLYITPGSPWENGHIESFHDKFRDECHNRELFGSLLEARVIVESWRMEYNEKRPHCSLKYLTPSEYGRRNNPVLRSAYGIPAPMLAIHPTTIHNIKKTNPIRTSVLMCPNFGVRSTPQTSPPVPSLNYIRPSKKTPHTKPTMKTMRKTILALGCLIMIPVLRADAVIDGQTVVVSAPEVKQPVAVRYAWADNPTCNLDNKEGLPASPFQTDDVTPPPAPTLQK